MNPDWAMMRTRISACVFLLAFVLVGCGSQAVVSGKVTYKGAILTAGEVSLIGADGKSRSGLIGADGMYEIVDAPLGDVTIIVVSTKFESNAKGSPLGTPGQVQGATTRAMIPPRYGDPRTSGLNHRVVGGRQTKNLDLGD